MAFGMMGRLGPRMMQIIGVSSCPTRSGSFGWIWGISLNQWGCCCIVVQKCMKHLSCHFGWWVGWPRHLCIWWGSTCLKGKGGLGSFSPHWFEWRFWMYFWNRNEFDSCMKNWQYFRRDSISLETLFIFLFYSVVCCEIEDGIYKKFTKM